MGLFLFYIFLFAGIIVVFVKTGLGLDGGRLLLCALVI